MTLSDREQVRNVVALIIAQGVAAGAGFIAFVRIGSIFNVVELGRYGFAASSTMLFGLLAELGMRYVAIREIAVDKDVTIRVLRHSVVMRVLLSIAALALLAGISELYPPWRNETWLLSLAGLVAVTQFGAEPITWVLFGHGRVDIGAGVLVIDRIFYVLAINAAAMVWHTAESLFVASLAANVLRSVIAWFWLRPILKSSVKRREWDPAFFKYLLVDGMALGIAVLLAVGYSQMTTVIAQSVTTPSQLGFYAVAIGLVNIFLIVPMALTNALFPSLAALIRTDESQRLSRTMIHLTLLTVIPLGAFMFVLAGPLLAFWFGAQYAPAAPAVRILAIGMIATGFNYLCRILLFAQNRPWLETAINIGALAAVISAGWPAGARYGSVGIAVVYTMVETAVLLVRAFVLFHASGVPAVHLFGRGLLAAVIPAAVAVALPMADHSRALLLLVCMTTLMFFLGVIPVPTLRRAVGHVGQMVRRGPANPRG